MSDNFIKKNFFVAINITIIISVEKLSMIFSMH